MRTNAFDRQNTGGLNIHIPMPGHPISSTPEAQEETCSAIEQLQIMAQDHDVIFLLTDSRESRWLPTLIGTAYNKIVVTAALGFDTYLVMRHGTRREEEGGDYVDVPAPPEANGWKSIGGDSLGCYFCNDITAPGNVSVIRILP